MQEADSSVCGFSSKQSVKGRPQQWPLGSGYEFGPVNHAESFLADILVLKMHTICV